MTTTGLIRAGDIISVIPTEEILEYKKAGGDTWLIELIRDNMKDRYEVEEVSPEGMIRTASNCYQHLYIPEELCELVWTKGK